MSNFYEHQSCEARESSESIGCQCYLMGIEIVLIAIEKKERESDAVKVREKERGGKGRNL